MAAHPGGWDWALAGVHEALTPEQEAKRAEKRVSSGCQGLGCISGSHGCSPAGLVVRPPHACTQQMPCAVQTALVSDSQAAHLLPQAADKARKKVRAQERKAETQADQDAAAAAAKAAAQAEVSAAATQAAEQASRCALLRGCQRAGASSGLPAIMPLL